MEKHVQAKKKKCSNRNIVLVTILLILAAAVVLITVFSKSASYEPTPSFPPQQGTQHQPTADPEVPPPAGSDESILLSGGLQIVHMANYAGIYMEDGSDEVVASVMMIILENTSKQDLQLARIYVQYPDFTAEFEVTNLPAGEKAVLLEKNRRSMPERDYISIEPRNVSFFREPMSLMEDIFEITGGDGYLDVKNISDSATSGKIYVYYKHAASDLLYGGITFRAAVDQPIDPGETIRILTNHYTAESSRILAVTCSQ